MYQPIPGLMSKLFFISTIGRINGANYYYKSIASQIYHHGRRTIIPHTLVLSLFINNKVLLPICYQHVVTYLDIQWAWHPFWKILSCGPLLQSVGETVLQWVQESLCSGREKMALAEPHLKLNSLSGSHFGAGLQIYQPPAYLVAVTR